MKPYIVDAWSGGTRIICASKPLTREAIDFCQGVTKADVADISRREFIRRASGIIVPAAILGGLVLPNTARAGSVTKVRTISAATETAIQMSNSTWARSVTLPGSWNTVRLGWRWHFTDSGANLTGNPNFAAGLLSGTANQFGDATTSHFLGFLITSAFSDAAATWTRYATAGPTGGPTYEIGGQPDFVKRIGTTNTNGGSMGIGGNMAYGAAAASAAADRIEMMFNITKGSPNYTLQAILMPGNSGGLGVTASDVSSASFLTAMAQVSPTPPGGGAGYGSGGNRTIAVSEGTNGTFDSINFYWNRTDALVELCDVAVAVIA